MIRMFIDVVKGKEDPRWLVAMLGLVAATAGSFAAMLNAGAAW